MVPSLKAQEQLDTTWAKETSDLHNYELMELTHLNVCVSEAAHLRQGGCE